jgi:hypothetical protein
MQQFITFSGEWSGRAECLALCNISRKSPSDAFFVQKLANLIIISYICSVKAYYMVQDVGLNQAQMDFLRLLSHFKTEEEVRELNDLVCKYYAQKIDEEMDRLWDEGKWSHEKIEETLKEHLRTPYHV